MTVSRKESKDADEKKPIKPNYEYAQDIIIKEDNQDSSLLNISLPARPIENKLYEDYIPCEELKKNTFHPTQKVIDKNQTEIRSLYFKQNLTVNNSISIFMSELEAVCAALHKFLAPYHTPTTYAAYNSKNEYVGVLSEEFPNFKSVAPNADPLTDDDLNVDFIEKNNLSFSLLEELEEKIRAFEDEGYTLDRQYKKIEENDKAFNLAFKQPLKNNDETKTESNTNTAYTDYIKNAENKVALLCQIKKNEQALQNYYKEIEEKYKITNKEIQNFRIIRGLATTLTASYIMMEDDLHQNNISKDGRRIDFDMALWPLLYTFSEKGLIDSALRRPWDKRFIITANDITHFPNLTDAKPFYWPTHSATAFSETTVNLLKKVIPLSANAYPQKANLTFQKLEKNPVFIHYKYETLLKYLLTNEDIYKKIAALHLRREATHESTLIIDKIASLQEERIKELEKALVTLPEFHAFFYQHGKKTLEDTINMITQRNNTFNQKASEAKASLKKLEAEIATQKSALKKLIETKDDKDSNIQSNKKNEDVIKIKAALVKINEQYYNQKALYNAYLYQIIDTKALQKRHEAIHNRIKQYQDSLYAKAKVKVVESMNSYINPGLFAFGGYFRNHANVAKDIIAYCESLKPSLEHREDDIESLQKLRNYISSKIKVLPTGGMHTLLTTLLKDNLLQLPVEIELSSDFNVVSKKA